MKSKFRQGEQVDQMFPVPERRESQLLYVSRDLVKSASVSLLKKKTKIAMTSARASVPVFTRPLNMNKMSPTNKKVK